MFEKAGVEGTAMLQLAIATALLLLAPEAASSTRSSAPLLAVDPAVFLDDVVVTAPAASENQIITETIQSAAVNLNDFFYGNAHHLGAGENARISAQQAIDAEYSRAASTTALQTLKR